ncbi:MAG: Fe-only nitrogenase accessory protein AnfO [Rhodocyclaceae bacterium]
MNIAAYLDAQGLPTSLYLPGSLQVFTEEGDGETRRWHPCLTHAFGMEAFMPLATIKAEIARMVDAVGPDCRVLLSSEIRGLPYSVLQESHGFRIWKSDGPLVQQLDFVRDREHAEQARKKYELVLRNDQQVPEPMLTMGGAPGHYWIDLRAALEHRSNPTSREVLIPFLSAGRFVRLEVLCGHLPKWMAWEFERLDLAAETEEIDATGHGLRVIVYSRLTPEGRARKPGLLSSSLPSFGLACPRETKHLPAPSSQIIDAA